MKITKDEMMGILLDACPSFQPTYDEFVEEWKDDKDGLPYYLALSDLAYHLVAMLERKETNQLTMIFREVERLESEGDDYVSNAIVVGLLEDIQNDNCHENGTKPEDFRPFLLRRSQIWWDKLYRFWEGGPLLVNDFK